MIEYEYAILIDAFVSDEEEGSVIASKLEELPDTSAFHLTSAPEMSPQNAMKLGRQMGARLPDDVTVVGISAKHVYDFSEELSPPLAKVVPKMTQIVVEILQQNITIL